jgi:hypothetical protein
MSSVDRRANAIGYDVGTMLHFISFILCNCSSKHNKKYACVRAHVHVHVHVVLFSHAMIEAMSKWSG